MTGPAPRIATPSDHHLFDRWYRRRDERAVAELWHQHRRVVIHVVVRILGRRPDPMAEAQEVCDDAFVQALRTFDPGRAPAAAHPFRSWFLLIGRRLALNRLRVATRETSDAEVSVRAEQEDAAVRGQEIAAFRDYVLQTWLPSDWTAVELFLEGHSWSDVADGAPVTLPTPLPFQPGDSTTDAIAADLDLVARALRVTPKLRIQVVGVQTADESDSLGFLRAESVTAAIIDREAGVGSRIEPLARRGAQPCVEVEVIAGGQRTAAAQRMRLKNLVRRFREARP